jgi:hypothetical protein
MAKLSKNGVGLVVLALSLFGVEVTDSSVVEVIGAIGTIAGFVLMVINQLGRGDVAKFFFKK